MDEESKENLVPTNSSYLNLESSALTNKIVQEQDPDKLKDLTNLFEMNQRKKNIARINRLSTLLELVDDEVIMRFTSEPESFDHDQLLKYMDTTQRTINGIESNLNQTPLIQINSQKNEIHINETGLNRDSRRNVLDAVLSILEEAKQQGAMDVDFTDIEEEEN